MEACLSSSDRLARRPSSVRPFRRLDSIWKDENKKRAKIVLTTEKDLQLVNVSVEQFYVNSFKNSFLIISLL
jgi:putative heme iron utilization protein